MTLLVSLGQSEHRVETDDDYEDVMVLLLNQSQRARSRGENRAAETLEVEAECLDLQWRAHKQARLLPATTIN